MKKTCFRAGVWLFLILLGSTVCWAESASDKVTDQAEPLTAQSVFEMLKGFEGTWKGVAKGEGGDESEEMPGAVHEFRVASAGTVVMETMNQGTPHEMINMYHLDGDDLRLTHYCAANNQPQMKLIRQKSSKNKLFFDFIGGTNMDPEVDHHIHSVEITIDDENHILSSWVGYNKGKPAGVMNFRLGREQ